MLTLPSCSIQAQTSGPVPSQTLRVHYVRGDQNYANYVLWAWEDTTWSSAEGWPNGIEATGSMNGAVYYDVPLVADAELVGFLIVDKTLGDEGKDGGDKSFSLLGRYNEVWIREADDKVYVSADYEQAVELQASTVVGDQELKITFNTLEGIEIATLDQRLSIQDRNGLELTPAAFVASEDGKSVVASLSLDFDAAPFKVSFEQREVLAYVGWQYIDAKYAYDGPLGAVLNEDGTAILRMWSPMADAVSVVIYDANDQNLVVADDLEMTRGERGLWSIVLDETNTGIPDLSGSFYHYKVTHGATTLTALDPYAKSMAAFNSDFNQVGKGAIVDPSKIGPELSYAEIPGWQKKVDTIIWEIHVRDLTSDPALDGQLTAPFGTFEAVIDKLDYIQSLGVTHIQFLPVMSYWHGDELDSRTRELEYSAQNNNYNWGYDPHSYFSLSGMYSAQPQDPYARIREFKRLVQEIHARGMGVILDVVFNHTAQMRIFENLVPGYYHFMDLDGTPRGSFGGGRLGTTHAMSRRILLDSIQYWTSEFKVDGFRFDMMGDHDAESIQIAYDAAKAINPNIVMIGEGWITFVGDEGDPRQPADQSWMNQTTAAAVFSDEFRNELKSGYGNEGEIRFITGGARSVDLIFDNIKAQPRNFEADEPADVVNYIAAHDNLTLHDVIAQSIRKDPAIPANELEIHRRIRIGNAMVLTSQGVAFLHAGQEYGRTKQWLSELRPEGPVITLLDSSGQPFKNPYFIDDSYDSSDIINRFDWLKVTDSANHPHSVKTKNYTAGLIALRRSTDAFTLGDRALVDSNVTLLNSGASAFGDLLIAYKCEATNGDAYFVFVNADQRVRTLPLLADLTSEVVLVDENQSGTEAISNPSGFILSPTEIELQPLTVVVIKQPGGV